jgi:hypothetical protein
MPMDLRVGDVVRLRKRHPCGGFEWQIVRIGADIGLCCMTCGRRILVPRAKIEKRIKEIISRGKSSGR